MLLWVTRSDSFADVDLACLVLYVGCPSVLLLTDCVAVSPVSCCVFGAYFGYDGLEVPETADRLCYEAVLVPAATGLFVVRG